MRKILFFLLLLVPFSIYANDEPVTDISFALSSLSCPMGADYGICGGVNASLHNRFVDYMKKNNATNAIKTIDQMISTRDGSNNTSLDNWLFNPLIGSFSPEGIKVLPDRMLLKKAYKGGILILGDIGIQDADFSFYFISFIRSKRINGIDMLYVYNVPLIPTGSKQYGTYAKLYGYQDFGNFSKDMKGAFSKGKFNNKDVNAIYQSFVGSIKDVVQNVTSTTKNYSISDDYRFYNGKVQYRSYLNGVGKYQWSDTDIDVSTITFSSPINGKDKYGSFYGGIRLKMNGKNVFFEAIGVTSKISSLYFQDGKTDNVYIMDDGYGPLHILPLAKVSTLIVLNHGAEYDYNKYMNDLKKNCNAHGDNSSLYDISAIDNNFCYGTIGSSPGNQIEKKTERIK